MSTRIAPAALTLLAVLLIAPSCDSVDRARSRFGTTTTDTLSVVTTSGSGLMLALHAPGVLRAGEEGVLRVSVSNRSDTTARNIRLELIVPGWAEPSPPRLGDRELSMVALPEGGTRFAWRLDETPIGPGQTQSIDQRIRVPMAGAAGAPDSPWSRVVRARLLDTAGEPIAEVEGEISLDAAMQDTTGAAGGPIRDQIGAMRLGMTAAALRQAAPAARDTTWSQEGMSQRGAWVTLPGNGRALAVLSGDTVTRLEVRDTVVRTRERLGVGSRLEELRSAYGAACADTGEGTVVVWFANAPGISFALDTPVPADPAQLRSSPDRLPGTARVTRWWLRRGGASPGC
ncbi:hypothetical protein BH23GEM9_BH23GEM9_07890 [soil metagenome]